MSSSAGAAAAAAAAAAGDDDDDDDTLRLSLEKVAFRPPTQVTDDTSVLTLKNLVCEPLLRWRPGGRSPAPALLARWEQSRGGREWRFALRSSPSPPVFHDGAVCTAADVVACVRAVLAARDTFGMRWSYHRYLARARIEAVAGDDDVGGGEVVRVVSPEPLAAILDIFTEFYVCRVGADGLPTLGTGPYRVGCFDAAAGVAELLRVEEACLSSTPGKGGDGSGGRLEETKKETKKKKAPPSRILATAEPVAEERLRQLRAGQVDAAMNLERVDAGPDWAPDLRWGQAANTLSVMYYLNCREGSLFANPAARRAVNLAVDREALIREVFHGLAIPAATVVSPFHLGRGYGSTRGSAEDDGDNDDDDGGRLDPLPYDVAEARRLLRGLDTSRPVVLRTPTHMPERATAISDFVAASLEAVGLNVRVEVEGDRAAYARQVGLDKRVGDLALFDSSPHSTFRVLDDKVSGATRAVWWQGYRDGVADRLIGEASVAVGDDEREAAYRRCLVHLRENPPWLYVVHPVEVFAAAPDVQGLSLDCKGVLNIE
ncbi:periplasmic binding protein-like II [Xylariaceae sp. FL0804]|nr:periplasmic binding protein-like II [Xylariaceae sp. FL0804]